MPWPGRDRRAATLAAATSPTWTKSRRWRRPRTPGEPGRRQGRSGRWRPRPSRACRWACAGRRRCGSAGPPPGRRSLWPSWRPGVPGRAWWWRRRCAGRRGVLGDDRGRQGRSARRAARLEAPGVQVGGDPWPRAHPAVFGAVVGTLAVDDHRGGQHQAGHAVPGHGGQQHGRAVHVDRGVVGQVGDVDAEPDLGGLVQHRVHPRQQCVQRGRVADVPRADLRPVTQVERDDLVAGYPKGLGDVAPDETGGAGDQCPHPADVSGDTGTGPGSTAGRKNSITSRGRGTPPSCPSVRRGR